MLCHLDDWETCDAGSDFTLELQAIPAVGETMFIAKELMNPRFFTDKIYIDQPVEECDGLVQVTVSAIQHLVTKDGHKIEIGIEL